MFYSLVEIDCFSNIGLLNYTSQTKYLLPLSDKCKKLMSRIRLRDALKQDNVFQAASWRETFKRPKHRTETQLRQTWDRPETDLREAWAKSMRLWALKLKHFTPNRQVNEHWHFLSSWQSQKNVTNVTTSQYRLSLV